ncbi:MAG: hypothetical protein J1F02_06705 [Lachnospiraceae bacterium]|nr:hypothetical protein [Lachnospiraceae bacterium]
MDEKETGGRLVSGRTLLVGCDLGDEKTQLAVYNRQQREPVLVGQTEENPDALMDTAIYLEEQPPLRDFLPKIRQGEEILVEGRHSNPVNVLAYFFRKTLSLTRQQYPSETIQQLVVTVEEQSMDYIQLIYDALAVLGIGRDRALVISHKQSYLYYVLYQKKELWINDVGLFDYDGRRLRYYQMQVDRQRKPALVGVTERDFSDAMENTDENGHRGAVFENIAQGAIHKQILSALYMTGEGFEGEWADPVFRRLCVGRRLFRGRNLYVSGACYAAREVSEKARLSDYILLDEEMIFSHISAMMYTEAKEQEVIFAKAGTPWYQVDKELDIIPDGETELKLTARNLFTREEKHFILDLEPVSGKSARQCRLGVRVRFDNVHTCVVTLRDKGFGEMFPTSNRIWEKTLTID